MEEELNENELEERLYAMLHYVDETQANVDLNKQNESLRTIENAPRSTLRRYWRTSGDQTTSHQKINTPKENTSTTIIKNTPTANSKPKEEKPPTPTPDLSIFQSPIPQNIQKTIEILDNEDNNQVILESSDEDEVIEVALPPKPTITIESSDEDEISVVAKSTPVTEKPNTNSKPNRPGEREVSASPVPSVVSSVSDEFIRGDCIALNISSRCPDNHSFDFSLHGSDILDQSTPAKKKKKKKTKDASTSTPNASDAPNVSVINADECFATPKSKAKNKKQKNKTYAASEKSLPSVDLYDSDSNQSIIDTNKSKNTYVVTNKSVPSADVYESDSNQSEVINVPQSTPNNVDSSASNTSIPPQKPQETPKSSKKNDYSLQPEEALTIDLTENDSYVTLDEIGIDENIVIGNVTGFTETDDYDDDPLPNNNSKFGSTNLPAILNEDLDFDNFKGKDKVCKKRQYSLTTLRAEMEKFYNESWGGENFNHREIQKNMSRDKSLWVIDPKDRMPALAKRKVTCNYCNRPGHRDDACRAKPPVCYMCGSIGHYEPRCPSKICVNCGSPNHMYSTMCRNCSSWGRITCAECGQNGHPSSHCPDLWRRYHNTIDTNTPLEENRQTKKHHHLYCSGCTRRGHLVHTCRTALPFSGFSINSPYVAMYRPIYFPTSNNSQKYKQAPKNFAQDSTISSATSQKNDRNKRQSKSPTRHETHVNKKRNTSTSAPTVDANEMRRNTKSPVNTETQRKISVSVEQPDESNKEKEVLKELNKNTTVDSSKTNVEKAPDFIPIASANHDKKGHMIQDNEVSDTSDVVTSARIYVTSDIINKLKTEGGKWLKQTSEKHNVTVQYTEINSFLSIKGKIGDQEAFQNELREYTKTTPAITKSNNEIDNTQENENYLTNNLPKNRNSLLRELKRSFELLKNNLGDPKDLHKELTYLQNHHQQLLKQKEISPQKVSNNRVNINQMMKKLNMVLLGQAGLADGSKHLSELYTLQEKITNSRQKTISNEMRIEVGRHYHSIFTAIPRDDYAELVRKYYSSRPIQTQPKKSKKEKAHSVTSKISRQKKTFNGIPIATKQKNFTAEKDAYDGYIENSEKSPSSKAQKGMLRDVAFFHKKILHTRPTDSILKKTKLTILRRLHPFISILFKKEKLSQKSVRKITKVLQQAQQFVSNMNV